MIGRLSSIRLVRIAVVESRRNSRVRCIRTPQHLVRRREQFYIYALVILAVLAVLVIDMALMPWASARLWATVGAIFVWGASAWGILLPQQHRLVTIAPRIAPVVLGLNTTCTYLGVTAAGVIGAASLTRVDAHNLSIIGAALILVAFGVSELATRSIDAADKRQPSPDVVSA